MPQKPSNKRHKLQIAAGTEGRNRGHSFEKDLTQSINSMILEASLFSSPIVGHLIKGDPALALIRHIHQNLKFGGLKEVRAWWVGGLATSREGDELLDPQGQLITKCKSDVILRLEHAQRNLLVGVSVKTCSKKTPTNDQLFFSTASAFCNLLRRHEIQVSGKAEEALRMFCGDNGFRPVDVTPISLNRKSDPDRWFWEELPMEGRTELEAIFSKHQREITTLLLQKAYLSDPLPPTFLLHQTVAYTDLLNCESAIFTIEELVEHSCKHGGFFTKPYYVRKGRFKGDAAQHLAPRFGFVQMQRGGQKQHPTQLQFNLQAGYFYKIS